MSKKSKYTIIVECTPIAPIDQRLTSAFLELRSLGYVAIENHACCQTCGWGSIPDENADKAVFYHAQDFDDGRRMGQLFLAWSGDGQMICNVLADHGLGVKWDGSEGKRILVII